MQNNFTVSISLKTQRPKNPEEKVQQRYYLSTLFEAMLFINQDSQGQRFPSNLTRKGMTHAQDSNIYLIFRKII